MPFLKLLSRYWKWKKMSIENIIVLIKGGGEIASGVAHRLSRCHFRVCMTEIPKPQAVRREVSFCEAVYEGEKTVEGITAKRVNSYDEVIEVWNSDRMPLIIDATATIKEILKPDVMVDAIMSKKNLGTKITDAPLVIALGPGFYAGKDAHLVVETKRGHNLGKIIEEGEAEKDTGIPGLIAGFSAERVLRAPGNGILSNVMEIGASVEAGDMVASVNDFPITTQVNGIIRGLLRDGAEVWKGMKIGDVDPRGIKEYCYTISDKASAIGGGVLEGILSNLNW
jgi:xanthine dehydrogenase accessory factor